MDTQFIEDLRNANASGEMSSTEIRNTLYDYALETFNIKLRKNKSFDNMVLDFSEEMTKLSNSPMPETNQGMSISDLIQADDELEGKAIFTNEAKEDALELIKSVSIKQGLDQTEVKELETLYNEGNPELKNISIAIKHEPVLDSMLNTQKDMIISTLPNTQTEMIVSTLPNIQNEYATEPLSGVKVDKFELPKGFSPNLTMLGKAPGYCTLPWWIYQWIKETPNWKEDPKAFKHPSAHQTLLSLLYYIRRDGKVLIRETRNSSFVILE